MNYVLYNKELGLFFSGFGFGIYSKYIQNAHIFYSYGYACNYLKYYQSRNWLTGFAVISLSQVSKAVLYA